MKISKVLLNIESVICFIYGALYCFSLVFIPIGVYCFIAGRRFSYKAEHVYDTMKLSNLNFKRYVIFVSIFCFPLGLLSIIPYLVLSSNNVVVTDTNGLHLQEEDKKIKIVETKESVVEKDDLNKEVQVAEVEAQKDEELTDAEKYAKYEKLKNFKDKGIITEEELELAREQLFGKK